MKPKPQTHRYKTAFQLAFLAFLAIGVLNFQPLLDEYALATFKPATNMAAIETRLGLTTKARATLYRAQPQIDDKATFNKDCDTQPHELELGCYFRGRIYVLQIDNAELAPEMDAVAAHELLHAAWSGLSGSEKAKLGTELESAYTQVATAELKQRMDDYAKSEPGERDNELHSILGTEFSQLSPELEEHYAKYFTARQSVVAAHAAYQQVFDSRRSELENELSSIRSEKGRLGVLNAQLEAYRSSNQIETYNSLVPRQNSLVDEINKRIASYAKEVDEYNALSKGLDSQQITDTETPAQ